MPAGDYSSSRYSELAKITPANAANLHVSWAFSTGVLRGHEGQPLVIGNTMYVITPYPNVAYAIDLATPGQPLKWKFRPDNSQQAAGRACCDVVNRGAVYADGKIFYVADMKAGGVFVIDGDAFTEIAFLKTGIGAHGLYPSRDGSKLYVANRGSAHVFAAPRGKGSVSVIDFTTRRVVTTWPIPGGGSPDMGNVSVDGKTLWLSGRFDNVVYAIDTTSGEVRSIPVGKEPHGLAVWPQPGRYSLGHTGNMR